MTANSDSIIRSVTATPFETPLFNPFVTSQGAAYTAKAVAVDMMLADGRSVLEACRRVAPHLIGLDVSTYRKPLTAIAAHTISEPSARCGLEMAVLDAFGMVSGISLHRLLGAALPSMATDITIPIVPNAGELAEMAWAVGMRVFKIKVGDPDRAADAARVKAIRAAAPNARLRIDANQAFTPEEAISFIRGLIDDGAAVEMLEQPVHCDDFEGLNRVAERSPVPVFADESCRTPADAIRLVSTTA